MKDIVNSYLNNADQRQTTVEQLTTKFKELTPKKKALATIGVILWISTLGYSSFKLTQFITKATARSKEQGKLSVRKNYM